MAHCVSVIIVNGTLSLRKRVVIQTDKRLCPDVAWDADGFSAGLMQHQGRTATTVA